ncbi:hypothetical protein H8K52_02650 [Undibacterium seohonense]|jgi:hypothetical protein|uniref:Uncharacterized protein n=1 Tax=Undibacterium seohonense TaxID=1344950 RepID=A0ABR6X0R6_9BURK|nr:hypothetical protein [Undibacterium seohonense]MBC3806243.1 hypothetical protein [Undibacterium seohonense]
MNEEQLRAELDSVYRSLSWRITAPLRYLSLNVKRLRFALRSPKKALIRAIQLAIRNQKIAAFGRLVVNRFPALKTRLRASLGNAHAVSYNPAPSQSAISDIPVATDVVALTPAAQEIYAMFQTYHITKK